MIFEGDIAPFAKAMVAAQMATEAVKKAASNPAFKSKYADLAHVVEAVVPALNANGICVLQSPSFDGELLSVTTTLLHESGARITNIFAVRPSKTDPQGLGSATTYARRYSLLAMTGAAPEDDDGNSASGPVEQGQRRFESRQSTALQTRLVEAPSMERHESPFDVEPEGPSPFDRAIQEITLCADLDELGAMWTRNAAGWKGYFSNAAFDKLTNAKNDRKAALTGKATA
jgi:hypothetical protein